MLTIHHATVPPTAGLRGARPRDHDPTSCTASRARGSRRPCCRTRSASAATTAAWSCCPGLSAADKVPPPLPPRQRRRPEVRRWGGCSPGVRGAPLARALGVGGVVLVAAVAGGVVLATRSSTPPPARAAALHPSRRARRLGAVRARAGQPVSDAADRPADRRRLAGPVHPRLPEPGGGGPRAHHDGTTDQLPPDRRPARHQRRRRRRRRQHARDGQCPNPPQQARNLRTRSPPPRWPQHPARLVLLQDGADDIHFAPASSTSWPASWTQPRPRHRLRRQRRGHAAERPS